MGAETDPDTTGEGGAAEAADETTTEPEPAPDEADAGAVEDAIDDPAAPTAEDGEQDVPDTSTEATEN